MQVAVELGVVFGLTLLNAFFSGAEIAVLAVRKTRLVELVDQGHRAAAIALRLRDDPERFLATVQIGITVVSATAAAFGGAVLEQPLATVLERSGLGGAAEDVAFAIVVAFVSVLSVVIGELVPKSLALRHSERVALAVSRPLFVLSRIVRPIVWFLTFAANVVLRPFQDRTTFTEARLSPEELQQLVEEAATAGTVDEETGEIASRAIDLAHLKAFSLMIPRNQVAWLPLEASAERVAAILRDEPHARYPVVEPTQHVVGYVLAHEVYGQLLERRLDMRALVREIPTFIESAAAVDILRALQRARSEIGLVVDDSGFPSGLVSIETLAEELFGEIAAEREKPVQTIAPAGEGTFDVRGDAPVHEVNRELELELPIQRSATTIGGLVVAAHGGFPERGARVTLAEGVEAEVLDVGPRRVLAIRLRLRRHVEA